MLPIGSLPPAPNMFAMHSTGPIHAAAARAPLAVLALLALVVGGVFAGAAKAQEPAPPAPPVTGDGDESDAGDADADDAGAPQDAASELPAPPPQRFALVGGTVHTMVAGVEPEVLTVIVNGDRIDAIGVDLEVPLGVERIDCTGKHVVPGLIDGLVLYQPLHDELYVTSGVTAVRDTGKNPMVVRQLMQRSYRDRVPGPHLSSAGAVFDGEPPTSPFAIVLRTEAEVEQYMNELARGGFDYTCLLPAIDPGLLGSIYSTADALGLDVWGMLPIRAKLEQVTGGGHRGLFGLDAVLPFNDATPDVPYDRVPWEKFVPLGYGSVARKFAEHEVAMIPLLVDSARLLVPADASRPELELLDFQVAAHWLADAGSRRAARGEGAMAAERDALVRERHERRLAMMTAMIDAGVELVPGTSASNPWVLPGASLHDELDLWVEAGMAPYEVLRAATAGAARTLGLDGRGTVASGQVADLLVTDGDPRESLASLRRPESVVVRGRRLVREDLDAMLERLRAELAEIRAENERPFDIAAPTAPEGAPLLAGRARCEIYGQRYQEERFSVVRQEDGRVTVASRIYQPASGGFSAGEIEIEQTLEDGLLCGFSVRVTRGFTNEAGELETHSMQVRGRWDGTRFSFERTLDGSPLGGRGTGQRPIAVVLDPLFDTITCPIVLGQFPRGGMVQAVTFGEQLEPILVDWRITDLPDGSRVVETPASRFGIRYDERGVPLQAVYETPTAAAQLVVDPKGVKDYGGAGLPVRFAAPVEASAPRGDASGDASGDETGDETGGGTDDGEAPAEGDASGDDAERADGAGDAAGPSDG